MNSKNLARLYNLLMQLHNEVERPSENSEAIKKVVFIVIDKQMSSSKETAVIPEKKAIEK